MYSKQLQWEFLVHDKNQPMEGHVVPYVLRFKHFCEWENNTLKHTQIQRAVHIMHGVVANSLGVDWCVSNRVNHVLFYQESKDREAMVRHT